MSQCNCQKVWIDDNKINKIEDEEQQKADRKREITTIKNWFLNKLTLSLSLSFSITALQNHIILYTL